MPMDIAPPEKHGTLNTLKAIEELPYDIDGSPKDTTAGRVQNLRKRSGAREIDT
jgi:hypothetical protein